MTDHPAVGQLREALGSDALLPEQESVPLTRRYRHLLSGDGRVLVVVQPSTVEQLQRVLAVARDNAVSLWWVADASGHGSGVGPGQRDVVLADLRRMNQILEVDPLSAYALVEPGVTYRQLHDHLQTLSQPFWIDCARDGARSIAAGICSHSTGYTPYGDRTLMQCGMEVLLSDGRLVRTGMGALPGSNMWQLFKYGYGPYVDGGFMQSDWGIVTKIGTWIMPAPPAYKPFMVKLPDAAALAAALEVLRPLKITPVIPNTVAIARAEFDGAVQASRADFERDGLSAFDLGEWNLYAALYGLPEDVDLLWDMVGGALGSITGSELLDGAARAGNPTWALREGLMRGVPGAQSGFAQGWGGADTLSVTAAAPIEGDAGTRMFTLTADVLKRFGYAPLCEFLISWRTLMLHTELPFDAGDDRGAAEARRCAGEIIDTLARSGYGPVTASDELMPRAGAIYPGPLADTRRRIKQALDPDGLLVSHAAYPGVS